MASEREPKMHSFNSPGTRYRTFLDRLRVQVERQVPDPAVQAELIKEIAQWNANEACRSIILSLPLEPPPSLAQMIEACTRKADVFSAPERNPGPAQPKSAAAVTPGPRKQLVPPQQLQHITCFQCKKTGHYARDCPHNQKQKKTNKQKKLGVPAINTITHQDTNIAGTTLAKASLFKTKGEDGTNGVGIQDNINVKCSINKGWKPLGRFNLMTTKGFYFMSTEWIVITVDLRCECFAMEDTAHTPLEIELLPMSLKGSISCLILLACCSQPPFYLVKGQILAQAIPVPKEITAEGKSPEVYWAEVVGENKPSLACNLTHGSDHLHVEGVLDTGADVTIIPERMWPSHWELQPVVGKIQGLGGFKSAKISKSIMQIEGPDGKMASVCLFVTDYKCPLWGRDTVSQWGMRIVIPKTP
ncbi:uncharacterized protein LOC116999776 [Catharus ustulatus]|uniref:uncharacterized protein LOC116999776 n=1 Tax=Catharus ustulatus TaxID=91951 RepID=UPI001408AC09|nr:uncharacterized protein LOC116999776 [Catharus ustulatus]